MIKLIKIIFLVLALAIGLNGAEAAGVPFKVTDFGAKCDSSTDDTTAIQRAITAATIGSQSFIGAIELPVGFCKVSSTLTITSYLQVRGTSRKASGLLWTSTTLNVISVANSANNPVVFENMTFSGPLNSSAGSVISISGANQSRFNNVEFVGGYDQIVTTANAYAFHIDSSWFNSYGRRAVTIQNTGNVDAGDTRITNTWFIDGAASSVGVYHISAGGLYLLNDKFNGGGIGYEFAGAAAGSTSDLIILGSSFENLTISAIKMRSAGLTFANVQINSNQIALSPFGIDLDFASSVTSHFQVNDNIINISSTPTNGIKISRVAYIIVSGNIIRAESGGTPTALTIDSNTSGRVGINYFSGFGAQKNIANASTSVTVTPHDTVTITQAATTSSAFGSLYSSSTTPTFATAFSETPTVVCNTGSVSGGLSTLPYAVTKTGFSLLVIGITNGGTGSASCVATGTL